MNSYIIAYTAEVLILPNPIVSVCPI